MKPENVDLILKEGKSHLENDNNTELARWRSMYSQRWGGPAAPPLDQFALIVQRFSRSAKILEVGCSGGYNLKFLSDLGFSNLYGIDSHEESIEAGRVAYPSIKSGLFLGDITSQNNHFKNEMDLVYSKSCLQQIPHENIEDAVKFMVECLTEQGEIIIYESKGTPGKTVRADSKHGHQGIFPGSTVFHHNYKNLFEDYGFEMFERAHLRYFRRE